MLDPANQTGSAQEGVDGGSTIRAVKDVAEAVLFLASDRSAQITGTVLPVEGGFTAGRPMMKR